MEIKRADLIQQLVDEHRYTKSAATDIVDGFTDVVVENLRNGNNVSIYGFGKFEALERQARSCPNPQTGEPIEIPAHFVPRFYPGTKLKLAVKMWEDDVRRGLM